MKNDLFSMDGRIALVTGASSGLGRQFARDIATAGATVIAAARRKSNLDQLVEEIRSDGGNAVAMEMDVTSTDSVAAVYDQAEADIGVINVLINNAGVAAPKYFLDVNEPDWDYIMETNLKGAWRVASACSNRLVTAKKPGSIVNISSILAFATQNKQAVYGMSKAAIVHMTHSMALELSRYRIRVNAIAPGYILTEINEDFFASETGKAYLKTIPSRRLGEPEELTGALLLLASDAGSFINGAVLPVDGGHLVAGR